MEVNFNPKEDEAGTDNKEPIEDISYKSITSDSHILSFSLTSVIDESFRMEQFHKRREHVKVVSDLSHTGGLKS